MTSDSDSEDEDLKLAIALSLQVNSPSVTECQSDKVKIEVDANEYKTRSTDMRSSNKSDQSITGLQSMDRKQMENERLARLKRNISNKQTTEPPSKKIMVEKSYIQETSSEKNSTNNRRYYKGVILKTIARPRVSDDISIEEVLNKENLNVALFSSFQWDTDWLFSKLNLKKTRVFMSMMATKDDDSSYKAECQSNAPPGVKLFWPPMDGAGNMHSKYMLLVYADYLRIVITSANFTRFDWGETGQLENILFLIDLPRLIGNDAEEIQTLNDLTPFGQNLYYFLIQSKAPDQAISGLFKFNFERTKKFAFVHSIAGTNENQNISSSTRTGLNSLSQAVKQLNIETSEKLHLEYATASLGALSEQFLQTMWLSARGILVKGKQTPQKNIKSLFKVYFPSNQAISNSRGGPNSAGTICLNETWYRKSTWPKEVLHEHSSTRNGLLSHSKIILGHSCYENKAWVYIGSHNLSEAAWGKISTDRITKNSKITCRNWECGVIIPIDALNANDDNNDHSHQQSESVRMDIYKNTAYDHSNLPERDLTALFKPILDIPFQIPSEAYASKRDPWFFMRNH